MNTKIFKHPAATLFKVAAATALVLSLSFGVFAPGAEASVIADTSSPVSGLSSDTSRNWAGYSASNGLYTGIGATWTVPHASSTSRAADAPWVGIGGIDSNDLIQAGTLALSDSNGNFTYSAWYELLPSEQVPVSLTVKPGDSISVSITEQSSGNWNISFVNNTTGQSYQANVNYSSSRNSAEWIQEMPLDAAIRQFVPLDNFGNVQFTNAWTIKDNIKESVSQAGGQPMTMVTAGRQLLAAPSGLNVDGSSFNVVRTNVSSDSASVSPSTPTEIRGRWQRGGSDVNNFSRAGNMSWNATGNEGTWRSSARQIFITHFRRQLSAMTRDARQFTIQVSYGR